MTTSIFDRIVDWLIAKAKKTPYYHLSGYMFRYWLIPFEGGGSVYDIGCYRAKIYRNPLVWAAQRLGIAARIHRIISSDDTRAFHDHPWSYLTIILRGGYYEIRPLYDESGLYLGDDKKWHGPGAVLWRPAKSWHRLEIQEGGSTWTLFITGRYKQKWGFLPNPKTKINYTEYLGLDKHD